MDSDLEGIETRQRSLHKAYESANAQASSIKQFTFQWKELEEHIEFTKELFKSRFDEVKKREVEIGMKETEMEAEKVRYKLERDAKAMGLHRIQKVVEEKQRSVEAMEKRLKEVEELVGEKEVDGSLIRKCNEESKRKLEWLGEEIRQKGVQLKYLQGLVEKQWKEYDLKEEKIREMIQKERDFGLLKKSMEEWGGRLEAKEIELQRWVEKLEGQEREIGAKIDEVNLIDKKVHERLKEVQLKEQQLYVLEKSLHVQSCGLQKKEEKIREMIQKESDFGLLKKSMEKWGGRLEAKEIELQRWVEKLEGQEREIGAKIDEVNLIDKKVHERLKEVQLKEQQLYVLEKSLHVQSCGLQKKERELEIKQEQLDSNVVQKSADIHTQNLKSKENSHQLKDEKLEDTTPAANNGNKDGIGLQLLMNQHLRRNNLMLKEIEDTLQRSPDPAKLVLDAMHGFYPSCSTVENNKFDLTVVRRSCTLLLKELTRASPKITPQLRGDAMKLAAEWKAKMNTENWFEVLGLLLLIAAYDLSFNYNLKELEILVGIIAQHNYDTTELFSALGLGANEPDQDTLSQSTLKSNPSSINCSPDNKVEKPADSPLANIQLTTAIDTDVTNSQVLPNEHLRTENQLIIPVVTDGSCQSLVGLAGKVLASGMIPDLIAKKQLLKAVVLSCNLKLTEMFPPVPLLRECAEGAIRNGSKAIDDQISVLKGVIGCIKNYKLEYQSEDIELQLRKLEILKVDGQTVCSDAKPLGRNAKKKRWRNQNGGTYISDLQPPQQAKKKYIRCFYCNEPGHIQTNCPLKW